MNTTIATSLLADELKELDRLRRDQGLSRADAICDAIRWYVRWAEKLPFEDPTADETEA
jgi:metal-responsive CopG/Arc/MetJ family transcriptional regulator